MLAEFVYCYLLRPWPLRQLTNWTIRKLLPKQVEIHGATVVLNPTDPVVSGALHFGVYEKAETRFFQSACRDGMTFLDVGANLGYYTALAARAVGPNGRVLAVEPDPDSFGYLEQTIAANAVGNVKAFPVAASDAHAMLPLYISTDNRGDNRLYASGEDRPQVEVSRAASGCLVARKQNRHCGPHQDRCAGLRTQGHFRSARDHCRLTEPHPAHRILAARHRRGW